MSPVKRVVAAFAQNSVFANILLAMVTLGALFAMMNMVREIFPEFSVEVITVVVPYPGADPEEVEEGISQKIEEAIDGTVGIKQYSTMSKEHLSACVIEVLESYDVSEVKDRVRNAVDSIATFPPDAENPVISEIIIQREVMGLALSGPLNDRQLKEWAEQIKDDIRLLPEVSQAEVLGGGEYEIAIEVSEDRLREYGITFQQVAAAVRASSLNQGGGVLRTKGEEIRLRTIGRKYYGNEFAEIVVLASPRGEIITLDQIATINDGFTEDRIMSKLDGDNAILLMISKTPEEDAIVISNAVKKFVAETQAALPEGLRLTVWNDTSDYIRARIRLLLRNGAIGLTLVFVMLWLFLDLRLSFWAAMGIPISLAGALVIMWAIGATINMISLFGLIMVLGIIVDDAIVVGEAIYVHRKNGDGPLLAAVNGTCEVGMPVVGAVTTTVVAFLPLMFVGGVMGKFIFILPIAVISALSISLVECLILLPAHLNHLPDPNRSHDSTHGIMRLAWRFRLSFNHGLEWFVEHMYTPFVRRVVHWRYVALCIAIAVLLGTVGMVQGGIIKYVMMPKVDGNDITANLEFPNGTPLGVTRDAVERLEAALDRVAARTKTLSGDPLIEHKFTIVGSTISEDPGAGMTAGPHTGAIRVELLDTELRGVLSHDLMVEWEKEVGAIPGVVSLTFEAMQGGPPGKPVEIWLQGDDMDEILAASDELIGKLQSYEGLYQIESDFRPGKNEIQFKLKPEARTLGITVQDLAGQMYAGYYGQEALRLQRGRDDIRVKVRYPEDERNRLSELSQTRIRTPQGYEVPLASVAEFSFGPGFSVISRTDGRRRVAVSADVNENRANANEILAELSADYFEQLMDKYRGVNISVQGAQKDTAESLSSLFISFPIAILGIYVIIATIFRSYLQPVVIMVTVPFGIIGAVFGHLIMGYPITLISLFGIVALAGVVVNDAIVLIECINALLAEGLPFSEALAQGGARRFRAIFLTTASTVGGLAPMIFETDYQAKFLIPMAISIAAGVAFATLLTLLLIPSLLAILNDFRRFVRVMCTGVWPSQEEVEPGTRRNIDVLAEEEKQHQQPAEI